MVKLSILVVRDLVAEIEGIESMVGKRVEVVKKIEENSTVFFSTPGIGKPKSLWVNKDVYLVNGPKSRLMSDNGRCDPVMVMFQGYLGNDIYSAEELGL